jgi:hypothetical protein
MIDTRIMTLLAVATGAAAASWLREKFDPIPDPWEQAHRKYGTRNNGDDPRAELIVPGPLVRYQDHPNDSELWDLVEAGEDPLAGLSFEEAVRLDPRRVDATIQQPVGLAMKEVLGDSPQDQELRKMIYLRAMQMARQATGRLDARVLTDLQDGSWMGALLTARQFWPPGVREAIRQNWVRFEEAFDEAYSLAERAAGVARRNGDSEGNLAWRDYASVMTAQKDGLYRVTTPMLQGRRQGRRQLPYGRRMLPGPGGRGRR